MLRSMRRVGIAVLLSLPGIGLAFVARPLRLGVEVSTMGIALAFALPVWWLIRKRPVAVSKPNQDRELVEPGIESDLPAPVERAGSP
jgi:hypothetical protein